MLAIYGKCIYMTYLTIWSATCSCNKLVFNIKKYMYVITYMILMQPKVNNNLVITD